MDGRERYASTISVPPTRFPRLSWQSPEQETEVLNLILRDVLDTGGVRQALAA